MAASCASDANNRRQQLLLQIECPACLEYFNGKILLCRNGHSVCATCRRSLRNCPVCRVAFTLIRNYAMESVAEYMEYPCKYAPQGCMEHVLKTEKTLHEANCAHRTYKCQMKAANGTDCTITCLASEMKDHAQRDHSKSAWMQENNLDRWQPDIDPNNEVQLICAHDALFYLTRQTLNDYMYWCLSYIGADKDADGYNLHVEFPADLVGARRTVQFTDVCQTFDTSALKRINDGLSIGLPKKLVESFKTNQRSVWYRVQVTVNASEDSIDE